MIKHLITILIRNNMIYIIIASVILVAVIIIAIRGSRNLDKWYYSDTRQDAKKYYNKYIKK